MALARHDLLVELTAKTDDDTMTALESWGWSEMLLVVDVGNTQTVIGLSDGGAIVSGAPPVVTTETPNFLGRASGGAKRSRRLSGHAQTWAAGGQATGGRARR